MCRLCWQSDAIQKHRWIHLKFGSEKGLVEEKLHNQWHFPLFSYFSVVVCRRCLLHHILSLIVYTFRENREFVFISIVQFMMSANSRIRFGLQMVFACLYITPSHYHFLCDDWENIYTLSYYHHQIGSMNYNPLFRVRSWNNGMRCMSFYILITFVLS